MESVRFVLHFKELRKIGVYLSCGCYAVYDSALTPLDGAGRGDPLPCPKCNPSRCDWKHMEIGKHYVFVLEGVGSLPVLRARLIQMIDGGLSATVEEKTGVRHALSQREVKEIHPVWSN